MSFHSGFLGNKWQASITVSSAAAARLITILFLSPPPHYHLTITSPLHGVSRSCSGPGAAGNQWVLQTQSTLLLVILSIIIILVQCLASPSPLSELWLVTWPQRWALIGRLTPYCVLCGDWARITAQTSAAHRLITRSHFLLTRDREQNVDLIPPGYPSLQCGEEAGLCSDQWAEPASTRQPISTGTQ